MLVPILSMMIFNHLFLTRYHLCSLLVDVQKDFKYLDKCVWDGLLPTLNTPLTPEQFEEGRKVHPVDGYMIVDIPHDGHWQT